MKTFNSLSSFAKHLEKVVVSHGLYETAAANFIGEVLKEKARERIGHLQEKTGPFNAWAELKPATQRDKERQGYAYNDDYNPLLRNGKMRESISYDFNPALNQLRLGSDDQIMVYQELGTKNIPPRSVLGATMFDSYPVIGYAFEKMITTWLQGTPFKAGGGHGNF